MKSYRKELWFNISSRRGFINITSQVEEALRESEIKEGLCLVNARLLNLAMLEERTARNDFTLPLEDKVVTISRAKGSLTFSANFQLIAAMNPCPCGYRYGCRFRCWLFFKKI